MWTSWMARTLASHDEADHASRRARRPALDDGEDTIVPPPSPLAGPSTNRHFVVPAKALGHAPILAHLHRRGASPHREEPPQGGVSNGATRPMAAPQDEVDW